MGHLTYLVLILIWAGPLIILEWLMGADILLKRWKVLLPAILLLTLYLTATDSIALNAHLWTINAAQSLNIFLPIVHVPIEVGVFILVTNTLVTQGLILMWMPEMRQRTRTIFRLLIRFARRGPQAFENLGHD